MRSRRIDGILLAGLLAAAAAPCLAQNSYYPPWWSQGQNPYPPRPAPYRYPPQPRYWYPPQQPYRYAAPQAYGYAAPRTYRYPASRPYPYPASQPYGYSTPQSYQYAPPRQPAAPQLAYQPQPRPDTQLSTQPDDQPPPQPASEASPSQDGVLLMPSQEGSKDMTSAATAPLHDLNLSRQTIPPVLLTALADPYAAPTAMDCATLAAAVDDLTSALGPDYDNRPSDHAKGVTESGGLGLTLMHGAAASLLPYDGFIKTLSGASKHDDLVIRALAAGGARRAYLKGLGEDRQCSGGASPRHLITPAAAVYDGPTRPKYPIWWDRAG